MTAKVEDYLAGLPRSTRATVDALRRLVGEAHDGLTEHVKWNAPSFCHRGEDRITLGLAPKGGVRVVLHRGAKSKDSSAFRFEDHAGLARWPAADRAVMIFADESEVASKADLLRDLFRRWIEATASALTL